MSNRVAKRRMALKTSSASALLLLFGSLATEAMAQQAGWSRRTSQGIVSGPLPVPDPGSMGSGPPNYMQPIGNNMPDPGDLAPENGQMLTIFDRRF